MVTDTEIINYFTDKVPNSLLLLSINNGIIELDGHDSDDLIATCCDILINYEETIDGSSVSAIERLLNETVELVINSNKCHISTRDRTLYDFLVSHKPTINVEEIKYVGEPYFVLLQDWAEILFEYIPSLFPEDLHDYYLNLYEIKSYRIPCINTDDTDMVQRIMSYTNLSEGIYDELISGRCMEKPYDFHFYYLDGDFNEVVNDMNNIHDLLEIITVEYPLYVVGRQTVSYIIPSSLATTFSELFEGKVEKEQFGSSSIGRMMADKNGMESKVVTIPNVWELYENEWYTQYQKNLNDTFVFKNITL